MGWVVYLFGRWNWNELELEQLAGRMDLSCSPWLYGYGHFMNSKYTILHVEHEKLFALSCFFDIVVLSEE